MKIIQSLSILNLTIVYIILELLNETHPIMSSDTLAWLYGSAVTIITFFRPKKEDAED